MFKTTSIIFARECVVVKSEGTTRYIRAVYSDKSDRYFKYTEESYLQVEGSTIPSIARQELEQPLNYNYNNLEEFNVIMNTFELNIPLQHIFTASTIVDKVTLKEDRMVQLHEYSYKDLDEVLEETFKMIQFHLQTKPYLARKIDWKEEHQLHEVKHLGLTLSTNLMKLSDGSWVILDYGNTKSGIALVVDAPIDAVTILDNNSKISYADEVMLRKLNIRFDGIPNVLYGNLFRNANDKVCFKVLPKDIATDILIKIIWGTTNVKTKGIPNIYEQKAKYALHSPMTSNLSVGTDYMVVEKGISNKFSIDDI